MAGRDDLPTPAPLALPPEPPAAEPPGVSFAASARRLDPTVTKGEEALGTEPERHREAWAAYDEIPEVGELVTGSASLLSQCTLYVGFVDGQGVERRLRDADGNLAEEFSQPGDEQFVADCEGVLARFTDSGGSQRGLLLAQAENFDVTGDSYMVGWPVDEDGRPFEGQPDLAAAERWEVVSRGALGKAQGRWTIQLGFDRATKLPDAAVVYRMWRKHPRRPDDSRGWVLGSLDACRDLRVFTLAQRSAARSSIPAPILVTAQEASPKNVLGAGGAPGGGVVPNPAAVALAAGGVVLNPSAGAAGPGPGTPPAQPLTWAQMLEKLIGDAVMEVLRDAQSGRAVIPAVLAIAEKYVDRFHMIDLSRPIDTALADLVRQTRERLAQAADCPPEMLTGLGETNRWNGAQIADDEFRRYFRPKAMTVADAWTVELLWGGLRALKYDEATIRRVRVLVDARGVVAEPDRSKLATEGLKYGAIGRAAWRRACGFPESDVATPEDETWIRDVLGRPPTAAVEKINGEDTTTGEVNRAVGSGAPAIEATAQEAEPTQVTARRPSWSSLRTRSTASIAQPLTRVELAQQLAAIEGATRSRLQEACEAALDQSLARGGAKLKTWARKDQDMRGLLAGVDGAGVLAVLGPERAMRIARGQFADDAQRRREDLFAAALATLLVSFGRIAEGAYTKLLRLLGVAVVEDGAPLPSWATASIAPAEISRNIDAGATVLRESMLRLADREIFAPVPEPNVGEISSFRVPAPVVRRSLAAAGGASIEPGLDPLEEAAPGIAYGPTLSTYQPPRVGWEWSYGDEPRARPYEPHMEVDGEVFDGPDDDRLAGLAPGGGPGFPGDHDGCGCDWVSVFADEADG